MGESFENLVMNIENVHNITSNAAKGAVNQFLTIRNWAIGYYIVEFEQYGNDRAQYGTNLLSDLAEKIDTKGLDRTALNLCRKFYITYPQICETVSHKFQKIGVPLSFSKIKPHDRNSENQDQTCETLSHEFQTNPELLISRLPFSHLREIMHIDDPFERFFYEFECIRGTWSVRELRRQIGSNLYFRAGISKNPEILLDKIQNSGLASQFSFHDPVALEFLGLDGKMAVDESDLEKALMDHLQEFLLEMGKGFCFEARQKRIIIDDEYFYPDLVLYNRILHCSVIIELKNEPFSHQHFGQLNAYVAYFKENEMYPGDNPPVGILLCTQKGSKMVEYALSGMDNTLFVSTYMLQLPDKQQLREFLLKQMEEMGL